MKISKFSKPKNQTLEEIVSDSYKPINKKLQERARVLLKYFMPGLYHGLLLAEFLYRHKEVIINTIQKVANIWSDNQSPVSKKILSTAGEVLEGGLKIAKKELTENAISYIASTFAEESVNIIDKTGVIDTVSKEVKLENQKERFKDLLKDTIEKQVENVLKSDGGKK
ncbi:hypothetical protein FJZ19_05005 [Candidatus Pacearchaeota archaeon]|nr:hypothetical protein [Candidatus Pacearchaeota archaeon]